MSTLSRQANLFEIAPRYDDAQIASARQRMRDMIDRLRATDTPPWKDQMGVILDDGTFQRAMRLVPDAEAQSLWSEFDAEMERLASILAEQSPS